MQTMATLSTAYCVATLVSIAACFYGVGEAAATNLKLAVMNW